MTDIRTIPISLFMEGIADLMEAKRVPTAPTCSVCGAPAPRGIGRCYMHNRAMRAACERRRYHQRRSAA